MNISVYYTSVQALLVSKHADVQIRSVNLFWLEARKVASKESTDFYRQLTVSVINVSHLIAAMQRLMIGLLMAFLSFKGEDDRSSDWDQNNLVLWGSVRGVCEFHS